jgi:hypothetical protein
MFPAVIDECPIATIAAALDEFTDTGPGTSMSDPPINVNAPCAVGLSTVMNRLAVTVIWNEAAAGLPAVSVAEQFTVVVPIANVLPDGGVQANDATPTMSNTVAV